ncbi:DNA-binding protein [Bacteroidia bacterium]|nr:DNA-binding protein [Bacteroidia bacterium]
MELEVIHNKIFEVRGFKVMTDFHLAELYQIETRALKQAVRRNIDRFPDDFMFVLSNKDANELIHIGVSQNVIPPDYNIGNANIFVFTEQGVAMLSSILKSKVAININISIMRAFVYMRHLANGYAELKSQLDNFMEETNVQFSDIYQVLTLTGASLRLVPKKKQKKSATSTNNKNRKQTKSTKK